MAHEKWKVAVEVVAASLAALLLLWLSMRPGLSVHVQGAIVSVAFFGVPAFVILTGRMSAEEAGLGALHLKRAVLLAVVASVVTLVPYALLFTSGVAFVEALTLAASGGTTFARAFTSRLSELNAAQKFVVAPELLGTAAQHLLGVAIPEELFFRGYLQSRLDGVFGRRWRLFGTWVGPGLFVASLVFAVAHFVTIPSVFRLAVFFPSLLFGYLRARGGGIAAPSLYHAACNTMLAAMRATLGVR